MVYQPTSRVLTVLELLQSHAAINGAELARRLEVDPRTIRRYIVTLQDLGIPIEATTGRHGGYRLRAGFKLPPMMFTAEEATALALGLQAVRSMSLDAVHLPAEGAIAKLERVLPDEARQRVQALQQMLVVGVAPSERRIPVAAGLIADLTLAAREGRCVRMVYGAGADQQERTVQPYGVVSYQHAWYLIAWCQLRQALRNFRCDRIEQAELTDQHFTRPPSFDCLAYLLRSIADIPDRWEAQVLLHTTMEEAQRHVPPEMVVLEQTADGVRVRAYIDDLDRIARLIAGLTCPVSILGPPQLRDACRRLADRLYGLARTADRYGCG